MRVINLDIYFIIYIRFLNKLASTFTLYFIFLIFSFKLKIRKVK